MTGLIVLLIIAFLGVTAMRLSWVRDLGPEPPFRTEDDPAWTRRRWLGMVD